MVKKSKTTPPEPKKEPKTEAKPTPRAGKPASDPTHVEAMGFMPPPTVLRLVDRQAQTIAQAAGQHPVLVVDCWAEWCGPCKQMGKAIKALASEMPDVAFGKLDIEVEKEEARRLKVGSIPTLLIYLDGELLDGEDDRIIGFASKTETRRMIEEVVERGMAKKAKKAGKKVARTAKKEEA